MKYLDSYRDGKTMKRLVQAIHKRASRAWTIMEICGGQTHSIMKHGLDQVLPIELVHGPGCPVCVTALETIDRALNIAARPEVIFCSFGDMARVPGSHKDLLTIKAEGADVRLVYSPLDALALARRLPDRQVVFFGVGFETTAPVVAMAVKQAQHLDLRNFSVLASHVLVPPAMSAILADPQNRVQGFLAAGHVCTVTGYQEYHQLAVRFAVPMVVTGFEPVDILEGILMCVELLESGQNLVRNQYSRSVQEQGNPNAMALIHEVFRVVDRNWRGIGNLPQSGWDLRPELARYDAARRFEVDDITVNESSECRAGQILQGRLKPNSCPAFGTRCTPDHPWVLPWSPVRVPVPPIFTTPIRPEEINEPELSSPLPARETDPALPRWRSPS